jgi:hypothetical protein
MIGAIPTHISGLLSATSSSETALSAGDASETLQRYYEFPLSTVPYLVARTWLLTLGGLSAVLGVIRQNKLVVAALAWILALYLLGKAYVLSVPLISITNLGAVLILLYLPIGLVVGSAAEEVVRVCQPHWRGAANAAVALAVIGGVAVSPARAEDLEPHRYFVTPEDMAAMEWIKKHTPLDALFAVNTYFWLPRAPHGADAGYWIPYFTGRQTTAGAMLLSLAEPQYVNRLVAMSQAVERLEVDNAALEQLRMMGVDYVYIGQRGDFSGPGLQIDQLSQARSTRVLYEDGGVSVLKIELASSATGSRID